MFLSTYALVNIGLSKGIVSSILKHSRQSQTKQASILPITLLTETQVNQALSHPQNESLGDLIATAYCDSVNATHQTNVSQENIKNQQVFNHESLDALQDKLKSNISPASKKNVEHAKEVLNQQLRVMRNIKENLNHAETQLGTIHKEIDDLAIAHDSQWSDYRKKRLEALRNEIEKNLNDAGLKMLPGEIDNLLREDLQDVSDRYVDLGVSKDLPPGGIEKLLGLKTPDFATYFRMKAYMAIRSTNAPVEERITVLKKLDDFFKASQQEAEALNTQQKTENHSVQRKIKPILEIAKSNRMELERLEQERDVELNKVTSIEAIREKVQQKTETPPPTPSTDLQIS